MSEIVYLSNVRLSFPHFVEPQRTKNEQTGKERISYNCELLMSPDHDGFKKFMQLYSKMMTEKYKEHAQSVMTLIQNDRKSRCYGQGEEKVNKKTFQPYDGHVGMVYITAGKDTRPQVFKQDGTLVDPMNTMEYQQVVREMYAGCRVNAAVKPWLQDNQHGRAVRCEIIAIQFAGNDTPFGEGQVDVSGMFNPVNTAPAPAFLAPQPQNSSMPFPPFMSK